MDANYIERYVAGIGGAGSLQVRIYLDRGQPRPYPLINDPVEGACLVADNSIEDDLPVQVVDAAGAVTFEIKVPVGRTTRTRQQMQAIGLRTQDDVAGLTIRNAL